MGVYKGIAGLVVLGLVGGAVLGWALGEVALGAGVGLVVAVGLAIVHRAASRKGTLYDRRVRPVLTAEPAARRNHVICIDGTWNHPDVPTNVRKLFDAVWPQAEGKRVKEGVTEDGTIQLAKYYRGVGARENIGAAYDFLDKRYSKTKLAGVTGYGVRAILRHAYADFVEDYRQGDRVFLFGFSRGATIARMLANYIARDFGLPESVEIRYQRSGLRRNPHVHRFEVETPKKHGVCEIELMGLWDTVAALGLPQNKIEPLADLSLSEKVKKVCHLVAIDEVRKEFDATLFDQDDRVEEVWMPGAHTNVGGGWADDCRLSDLALRLMLDRAGRHGLVLTPESEQIEGDFAGPFWEAGPMWVLRIVREIVVQKAPGSPPRIHPAVFKRLDAGVPGPDGKPYDPANLAALPFSRAELEHES